MSQCSLRDLAVNLGAMETIIASTATKSTQQVYTYLVVLDFEATCWDTKPTRRHQNEIIEFAAVLLHIPDGQIVATFKKYVRPTENPELSPFCTSLTGIKQSMVHNAATITNVLDVFDAWLEENRMKHRFEFTDTFIIDSSKKPARRVCTFATWSDWDLGMCLRKECRRKQITRRTYFNQWIDVRKTFLHVYKDQPMGLVGALHSVGLAFVGQEHSGIDDARNTALLINQMVADGCHLVNTKCL